MDLERAIAIALRLRDEIAAEVACAQTEATTFRTLDADAIFQRVSDREAFNELAAGLHRELQAALSPQPCGPRTADCGCLSPVCGDSAGFGAHLAGVIAEVRTLAALLRQLDETNARLAQRQLLWLAGYVRAVSPIPTAYDRCGRSRPPAPAGTARGAA